MMSRSASPEPKKKKSDEEDPLLVYEDVLDEVVLTPEEEEELLAKVYGPFTGFRYYHNSSDSGDSPSPEQPDADHDDSAIRRNPVRTRSITLSVPSREALMNFLHRFKMDGVDKTKLFSTCKWNSSADEVYSLFNISTSIVHPNYFLATEKNPNPKIDSILNLLEKSTSRKHAHVSWNFVKRHLVHFLNGFEGFENLANYFKDEELAIPLIDIFRDHLVCAKESENTPVPAWYSVFMDLSQEMKDRPKYTESCCHRYIEALINQLNSITQGYFSKKMGEISLKIPASKPFPEKSLHVKPDVMLLDSNSNSIMFVGEVKRLGCHGTLYETHRGHRGHRVKEVQRSADKPQGQGDQLPPTMNENDEPLTSSMATIVEPHASTSTGETESDTKHRGNSMIEYQPNTDNSQGQGDELPPTVKEKDKSCSSSVTATVEPLACSITGTTGSDTKRKISTFPSRPLDFKEKSKVDRYLPQLFGQMLAAMHFNTTKGKLDAFRLHNNTRIVQLGFAVEGFKLRFVKLTLYDHLQNKENPTVEALLRGDRLKCDISMTQEYNLLKRHHLEMFYQMLLAINYMFL